MIDGYGQRVVEFKDDPSADRWPDSVDGNNRRLTDGNVTAIADPWYHFEGRV